MKTLTKFTAAAASRHRGRRARFRRRQQPVRDPHAMSQMQQTEATDALGLGAGDADRQRPGRLRPRRLITDRAASPTASIAWGRPPAKGGLFHV